MENIALSSRGTPVKVLPTNNDNNNSINRSQPSNPESDQSRGSNPKSNQSRGSSNVKDIFAEKETTGNAISEISKVIPTDEIHFENDLMDNNHSGDLISMPTGDISHDASFRYDLISMPPTEDSSFDSNTRLSFKYDLIPMPDPLPLEPCNSLLDLPVDIIEEIGNFLDIISFLRLCRITRINVRCMNPALGKQLEKYPAFVKQLEEYDFDPMILFNRIKERSRPSKLNSRTLLVKDPVKLQELLECIDLLHALDISNDQIYDNLKGFNMVDQLLQTSFKKSTSRKIYQKLQK
ncbi:hypothetical protein BC833DRAFT_626419 [Globomyces pollinis-pini]|nr:hypothetical protein BC833DRAFT_626419 [Globomyces pollinis-pini]